jgi:hypothetical protein
VAGRPEDLSRIPKVRGAQRMDMRNVVGLKEILAATVQGQVSPRQIISMAGNQIQGIQFASVGGLTYHLI